VFDLILGLLLAALLVRGWSRGLVREVLDLAGLVAGLLIAFRLSAPFGDFLTQRFGTGPEAARIGAGVALFALLAVSMSFAARLLSKVMSLPGLNLVNRLGGAAVAAGWGLALALVVLNVALVLPIPETWKGEVRDSRVAHAIAGPEAAPQRAFEGFVGDNLLGSLATIQDLFGSSRAVPRPGEELQAPPAPADEVRQVPGEAASVLAEINRFRTGLELSPLLESEGMTGVAEARATSMYVSGRLHITPDCFADLAGSGVRVASCGEAAALAGTALAALEGILESGHGEAELSAPAYDRVGVSVAEGPTGRLLVVLLGG